MSHIDRPLKRFSYPRGLILVGFLSLPYPAWDIADAVHLCGVQGAELAGFILLGMLLLAAVPALIVSVALAFVPIRIGPKVVALGLAVDALIVIACFVFISLREVPDACAWP
jgi:hypothetical protein